MPFKIYDGSVTGLKDFGAFVRLENMRRRCEGLVHISMIKAGVRLNHPSEVVNIGDRVKVKVLSVVGTKTSLSMRDVDQRTGEDLTPEMNHIQPTSINLGSSANAVPIGGGPAAVAPPANQFVSNRRKRMSSPDRWELQQLAASGVIPATALPDFDEETGTLAEVEEVKDEIDVEIRDEEPLFLRGQTKTALELSPIKIIKNESGSLHRAAMEASSLAKERKDARQQQIDDAAQDVTRDLNRGWTDPMAKQHDRSFAADARARSMKDDEPEWKRGSFNRSATFGKVTTMSLKQQRESLPIYKLRPQLIDAIKAVSGLLPFRISPNSLTLV